MNRYNPNRNPDEDAYHRGAPPHPGSPFSATPDQPGAAGHVRLRTPAAASGWPSQPTRRRHQLGVGSPPQPPDTPPPAISPGARHPHQARRNRGDLIATAALIAVGRLGRRGRVRPRRRHHLRLRQQKSDTASTSSADSGADEEAGAHPVADPTPPHRKPRNPHGRRRRNRRPSRPAGPVGIGRQPQRKTRRRTHPDRAAYSPSRSSGVLVMPSNCAGAILPGIDYVYKSANYTGFAGQTLADDATGIKVIQSVISFNS